MNPWIIKIGGAALSHADSVMEVAKCVAMLKEHEVEVVIVHGGGPIINKKLREKNISWNFHQGQRITTSEMMCTIEEGLMEVNHQIQETLKMVDVDCMGLNGAKLKIFDCTMMDENLGLVGEVQNVDCSSIREILASGLTPVIAPIGINQQGELLNINADWGAAHMAKSLNATVLAYCTDQLGILDSNGSPYQTLSLTQLQGLIKNGEVSGGMLAKCKTIEFALNNGVTEVSVMHALEIGKFIQQSSIGTKCLVASTDTYSSHKKGVTYETNTNTLQ